MSVARPIAQGATITVPRQHVVTASTPLRMEPNMPQPPTPGTAARDATMPAAPPKRRTLRSVPYDRTVQRAAVGQWLLSVHPTPSAAQAEWDGDNGVAVLPLGTLFSAVRIPRWVVLSAIQLEEAHSGTLDRFLSEMLHGGPVISCQHEQRYYALTPADMPLRWHKAAADWARVGVEILGEDWLLGVPRLPADDQFGPPPASYWAVPMRRPGEVCEPADVARLIAAGVRADAFESATAQR
ncbi:hypothetical protein ACWDQ0_18015 [Streptomyces sp. NPDC003642]